MNFAPSENLHKVNCFKYILQEKNILDFFQNLTLVEFILAKDWMYELFIKEFKLILNAAGVNFTADHLFFHHFKPDINSYTYIQIV